MKQLVNRYDSAVRLIGLGDDTRQEGDYIYFNLPAGRCIWPANIWDVEDYIEKKGWTKPEGESETFRARLRKALKRKGYSAMGLSLYLGHGGSWMGNILNGYSRLRKKNDEALEAELGLAPGTLKRWRK